MNLDTAIALFSGQPIIRAAKWDLVFDPRKKMKAQIKAAANDINDHFQNIDAAVSKGSKIRDAIAPNRIEKAMNRVISSSMLSGFSDGAYFSGKKLPKDFGKYASSVAKQRANDVDFMMKRVTRRGIKAGSNFTLSPARAARAARYEASQAYYKGLRMSLAGSGMRKKWITSSADPCPDCQDNEDQGAIDFDDIFDSGHDLPLAHINCGCFIVGNI